MDVVEVVEVVDERRDHGRAAPGVNDSSCPR
jgi:hypothetical protein